MVLSHGEHILDIEIFFTFYVVTSIKLTTNLGKVYSAGGRAEYSSVCKVSPEASEMIPIVGFDVILSKAAMKEISIYRAPIITLQKKNLKKKIVDVRKLNEIIMGKSLQNKIFGHRESYKAFKRMTHKMRLFKHFTEEGPFINMIRQKINEIQNEDKKPEDLPNKKDAIMKLEEEEKHGADEHEYKDVAVMEDRFNPLQDREGRITTTEGGESGPLVKKRDLKKVFIGEDEHIID